MTRLVVLDPASIVAFSGSGQISSVDISSFTNSDYISVACPDYPHSQIDPSKSYLELTSNSTGNFNIPTEKDSISFSSSTTTLANGDIELRFPLSLLANVNRASITGVRFRIFANVACNVRFMALRVISANWVQAPIDINTLYDQASRPVPLNSQIGNLGTFPTTSQSGLPTTWPILFRSGNLPVSQDPQPIDASVAVGFKRGTCAAATGDEDYAVTFVEGGEVSVPDDNFFDFAGAFTLEAWINPSSLANTLGIVSKTNPVAGQYGYRFGVTAAGELTFEWSTNGTASTVITTVGAGITTGTWQHVAVTYSPGTQAASLPLLLNPGGTAIRFYKNGEMIYAQTGLTTETNVFNTDRPLKLSAWNTG